MSTVLIDIDIVINTISTVLIDIDIVINTMSTVLIDIDIVINTTIYNDMPKNLDIDDIDIYRDIYRPCMWAGPLVRRGHFFRD